MLVSRVAATVVRPLRTEVLRPGWAPGTAVMDEDDDAGTVHVAAFQDGDVAAVGTAYAQAPPAEHRGAIPEAAFADGAAWRLRGMASRPASRGGGYGAAVLEEVFAAAREAGAAFLWCNARLGAVGFYERNGLATVGPQFDMPGIGPHYVMWRAL